MRHQPHDAENIVFFFAACEHATTIHTAIVICDLTLRLLYSYIATYFTAEDTTTATKNKLKQKQ